MKTFLASGVLVLCCVACSGMKEVDFLYFNLSTNEVVVDSIAGLPPWASPGVLVPVQAEDRLSAATAATFDETVRIAPVLRITWREGGTSHKAELKRDDLGIPAKMRQGKVRFTYLGADKWRVKFLEQP
jgi:hypothetical protein